MPFEPELIATTLDSPDTVMDAWETINTNMLAIQDAIIEMESDIAVLEGE
jgi:hypothetical protein